MKTTFVVSVVLFTIILTACAPNPTPLPIVTLTPIGTDSVTPGAETFYGVIEYPYLHADAGNFQLQTGETITFTWKDAPPNAQRYDFVIDPLDGSQPIVLGIDDNASDGASIQWQVVPNISGALSGIAYYSDGQVLRSGVSGTIYSGPSQ